MNVEPVPATAYSLFVVGITAFLGSLTYMRRKEVNYITAVTFAVPAFLAVFSTRKFIIPAIPTEIISIGDFIVTKGILIMLLFALFMVAASVSMILDRRPDEQDASVKKNYILIIIEGLFVGLLSGLVGAGGGFLIIPALVLLARLPMKTAIGTSLLIIAVNSLIGFMGDIGTNLDVDWSFIGIFALLSIVGIFIGSYLSKFIEGKKLKPAFGWFVMIMGIYIISREIFVRL